MNADKEPCGLDITLDDIRKIENQYDVTIRIHFDKIARAWCFDFERSTALERYTLSVAYLKDVPKISILEKFAILASAVQMKGEVALAK